jgi:peptidoglycan/LPS O-acetylase OafA/YrhL
LTAADKGDWNRLVPRAPLITGASALLLGLLFYVAGEPAFENPWIGTLGISLLAFFFGGFLVLALVAGDQSVFSKVVASSVLRFFGKYSYCLYVAHQPLIQMLAKAVLTGDRMTALLHNRIAGIASVYAIAFAVTIAVALASWHLVEKHFLKLKDLAYFSHSPGAA